MNHLGIDTTVVNNWYWWEYEEYIKRLNDKLDKEQKANEQNRSQTKMPNYNNKVPDVNSMMKNINKFKK